MDLGVTFWIWVAERLYLLHWLCHVVSFVLVVIIGRSFYRFIKCRDDAEADTISKGLASSIQAFVIVVLAILFTPNGSDLEKFKAAAGYHVPEITQGSGN